MPRPVRVSPRVERVFGGSPRVGSASAGELRGETVGRARLGGGLALIAALLWLGCSSSGSSTAGGDGGSAGTRWAAGGAGGLSGAAGTAGAAGAGGASGTGGVGGASGAPADAGGAQDAAVPGPGTACALEASRLRVTEVQLPVDAVADEDEAALHPLVISPLPDGGSRLAFMGSDQALHVITLDAADQPTGEAFSFAAHDFSDLHADAAGGVLLLTRAAKGEGTLGCGDPNNLCGTPPNPPIPCFDMYMVRFDGATETWATQLTDSSAALPPYSTGPTGPRVFMIWWYAHHGRLAFDGARYAGYYGAAISVSEGGCINIHQGDRMQVVGPDGALDATDGFEWGCSHSGYERVLYDAERDAWITVCKTDNNNRIAFAPDYRTIRPVDLAASNLGELVKAVGPGYWLPTSDARAGAPGMAEVHLLRFTDGAPSDTISVECDAARNCRAPHLSPYGAAGMLLAWESSTEADDLRPADSARRFHVQARDRATGAAIGAPLEVPGFVGNRYHALRAFPDGSAVFPAKGAAADRVKVLRVLPCRE